MTKSSAYVTVGKIGSPYGIKGWLKIQSFTEFGASILDYQPWYLTTVTNERVAVTIEDGRQHGNGIIAKLPGINTPEEARLQTGKLIEVDRSHLQSLPANEFYWSDLEGLTVLDIHGKNLGVVHHVMATGSNDVLVIRGEKEHAIPYMRDSVIKNIDLEKGIITVDWEIL